MDTFKVGNYLIERDGAELRTVRLVTEQRGSWKWQDAFRKAYYEIRYSPRRKYHYFVSVARSGKFPLTRGRGAGLPKGGLHNHPVPAEMLMAWGTLSSQEEASCTR
jgi:hypothetical protein